MNQAKLDHRASVIIADCLRRADAGESIDPEQVMAQHPECAAQLRSYFADEKLLGDVMDRMTPAAPDGGAVSASEQPTVSPAVGDSVPTGAASFKTLPAEFGRYRIERILGQGAMGAVYLAHDTRLGRDVALKTPKLGDVADKEVVERFRREARAAAVLHHRNLCPVFDVGEIQGIHFLTMAYIDGVPLSKAVSKEKPPTERQCAAVVRKLAVALQEAHRQGVVHRDLKPANILMDRSREPVIMDFGLAYQLEQTDRSRLTGAGVIMGSPAYMSPEQVSGEADAVGPQTDIYSLGVILFELLTGQLPVEGSTIAVLAKILAGEQRTIDDVRPETDARLAAICSRMTAQRPEDRYPSMQAVADALGRWLKRRNRQAAEDGEVEDITSWVVLYEEPIRTGVLPPRQKKRKKRRRTPTDSSPAAEHSGRRKPTAPRRSRTVPWFVWLAAGLAGIAVLTGVIITLPDGTKIETSEGEHVEITSNRDGSTSVTVEPADSVAPTRSAAPAPASVRNSISTRVPADPGPHEILTSDDWTWSEPVFIGEFGTHGNMAQVLTDDFLTWAQSVAQPGDTRRKPWHDIALFTRQPGADRWASPVVLDTPINGPSDERNPCLSADGRWLLFQSNRSGGQGGRDDLWICERSGDGREWRDPVNLGPQVNSSMWEGQACFSQDGRTIYFSSDRRARGSALWMTQRETPGSSWSAAVDILPGKTGGVRGMNPTVSSDDRVLLFNCNGQFGGEGEFDVWMCQRTSPQAAWSEPVNIGPPVNTAGHEFPAAFSQDGKLLLFRRIPPEGKAARGHGFWSVRRVRKNSVNSIAGPSSVPQAAGRAGQESPAKDTDGWISLFNGANLSGWHTVYSKPGVWRAENGEIVCRRKRSSEQGASGWLATDDDFLNFELELEYNLERNGNSGIFLRAVPGEARNGADQLEVQLLDDNGPQYRDRVTEDQITGALYGLVPVRRRARVTPKKWNQLAIRLVGDRATVTVNGAVVTDAHLSSLPTPAASRRNYRQSGPIGLQWHGHKMRFRNLRIRSLEQDG